MSHGDHRIETAHVRRSPRYGVFLVGGAFLGVLAAIVLTLSFGAAPTPSGYSSPSSDGASQYTRVTYSTSQVLGFVALACVPMGIALGGIVALVLDRVVGRRTREVRIDREIVVDEP